MKSVAIYVLCGLICLSFSAAAFADTVVSKPPDLGAYWHPVGNEPTYVYADCFYAPAGTDLQVSQLGTWLLAYDAAPQHAIVRFEVWGATGGAPDCTNVIAASEEFSTESIDLTLYTLPVATGPAMLTAGQMYFFVVTGVGMGNPDYGQYQVGAHTQNSVYQDNCTFWYTNDAGGCAFSGGFTPEMAFEVTLTGTVATEAATWGSIKTLYR